MTKKAKIGVLLSGTGRTLDNLIQKIEEGKLPVQIAIVVSSHSEAEGIPKAKKKGILTEIVDWKKSPEPRFSERITELLKKHEVDLVVMAGFIRHWKLPKDFEGKVINIHPALLPEFGGPGMYGHRVHEAVWKAKKKESGCTVHWVDGQYDHGAVLLQKKVALSPQDTPETIAAKVFEKECEAYPEAILKILSTISGATS